MKNKDSIKRQSKIINKFEVDKNKVDEEKAEQFQVRYIDLARVVENGDIRRFQQLANNVDINELQSNNKPFVFYAIERDDKVMLKILFDFDINLDSVFMVEIKESTEEKTNESSQNDFISSSNTSLLRRRSTLDHSISHRNSRTRNSIVSAQSDNNDASANLQKKEFNALSYAKFLNRNEILNMISTKIREPPLIERWIRVIDSKDLYEIKKFKDKIKSALKLRELLQLGLIRASQKGQMNLVDFLLNSEKVNVNCQAILPDGTKLTPLLQAIENKRNDIAKHLIFRGADIHVAGEFGDALVTALHYDVPIDLIQLLLDKGASLASRHKQWPELSLREFCIQFSRVKAKLVLDEYICKLIANGNYEKLKYLSENGYKHLNIKNRLKKFGRQIALERYHTNIVDLIDKIEEFEYRSWIKMNYH